VIDRFALLVDSAAQLDDHLFTSPSADCTTVYQ